MHHFAPPHPCNSHSRSQPPHSGGVTENGLQLADPSSEGPCALLGDEPPRPRTRVARHDPLGRGFVVLRIGWHGQPVCGGELPVRQSRGRGREASESS
jgi:hypothetical protein